MQHRIIACKIPILFNFSHTFYYGVSVSAKIPNEINLKLQTGY